MRNSGGQAKSIMIFFLNWPIALSLFATCDQRRYGYVLNFMDGILTAWLSKILT